MARRSRTLSIKPYQTDSLAPHERSPISYHGAITSSGTGQCGGRRNSVELLANIGDFRAWISKSNAWPWKPTRGLVNHHAGVGSANACRFTAPEGRNHAAAWPMHSVPALGLMNCNGVIDRLPAVTEPPGELIYRWIILVRISPTPGQRCATKVAMLVPLPGQPGKSPRSLSRR